MWSIQILWADVWVTVQRGFKSRGDAEWSVAKWKQTNNCTGDPFRAYEEPEWVAADTPAGRRVLQDWEAEFTDEKQREILSQIDESLHCDQCGRPQWDDGSGLCSWRSGTEVGGCDGRQGREHDQRAEDEAMYQRELRNQVERCR